MHRQKAITETQEMYLKVLYEVRGKHGVARVRDLAQGLGVSPGAVSGVLKKLQKQGFVEHEHYGVLALTPAGIAVAECMLRRHATIRDVLIEVFGVERAAAEEDACMMEHAVSPTTTSRMMDTLRRVRSGDIVIPGDTPVTPTDCSKCEATGQCQAIAAAES